MAMDYLKATCDICSKGFDPVVKVWFRYVSCHGFFHYKCQNTTADEASVLNKVRDKTSSQIHAACNACAAKIKLHPKSLLFRDDKFFEDKINEKNNQLFLANAKINELEVKLTQVMAEKEKIEAGREDKLVEKDMKLMSLQAKVEKLSALVKQREVSYEESVVEAKALQVEKEALKANVSILEEEIAEIKALEDGMQSSIGGCGAFSEQDKLRAIEDLIKFHGKSLEIMTESFKPVVQKVKSIREEIAKTPTVRGPRVERLTVEQPRLSYAEA